MGICADLCCLEMHLSSARMKALTQSAEICSPILKSISLHENSRSVRNKLQLEFSFSSFFTSLIVLLWLVLPSWVMRQIRETKIWVDINAARKQAGSIYLLTPASVRILSSSVFILSAGSYLLIRVKASFSCGLHHVSIMFD